MVSEQWTVYTDVSQVWDSMLDDIERARSFICLEQYIFANDEVGGRFLDALMRKARQGVHVQVIVDGVGSYAFTISNLLVKLQESGAEVRIYNKVGAVFLHRIFSWYFRDHRKLLIVDGAILHTGGVGIHARMALWRDTHIRIVGMLAEGARRSFAELWIKCAKPGPHVLQFVPTLVQDFNLVSNSSAPRRRFLYYHMRQAIKNAQKSIYIITPYFVPDLLLFKALYSKAKQGVDVRILLPSCSDHRVSDLAASSFFGLALRAGIHIYLYKAQTLHANMVIDEAWSTVGSMNFDSLSFKFNLESNVVSTNVSFAAALAKQFKEDIAISVAVALHTWENRSWRQKIKEALLWPFHGVL